MRQNPHVRICGGPGSATTLVYPTGVLLDPAGYIITNAHVVAGAARVQVVLPVTAVVGAERRSILRPRGRLVGAQVVGIDLGTTWLS